MNIESIPIGLYFTATISSMLVVRELGYRLEHTVRRQSENEKKSAISTRMGTVLGLLAFILIFTFGIMSSRYKVRRTPAFKEVDNIDTTYLRYNFLSEPQRSEIKRFLKQYIDLHWSAIQSYNIVYLPKGLIELEGFIKDYRR